MIIDLEAIDKPQILPDQPDQPDPKKRSDCPKELGFSPPQKSGQPVAPASSKYKMACQQLQAKVKLSMQQLLSKVKTKPLATAGSYTLSTYRFCCTLVY
jgi:hypothetical protein